MSRTEFLSREHSDNLVANLLYNLGFNYSKTRFLIRTNKESCSNLSRQSFYDAVMSAGKFQHMLENYNLKLKNAIIKSAVIQFAAKDGIKLPSKYRLGEVHLAALGYSKLELPKDEPDLGKEFDEFGFGKPKASQTTDPEPTILGAPASAIAVSTVVDDGKLVGISSGYRSIAEKQAAYMRAYGATETTINKHLYGLDLELHMANHTHTSIGLEGLVTTKPVEITPMTIQPTTFEIYKPVLVGGIDILKADEHQLICIIRAAKSEQENMQDLVEVSTKFQAKSKELTKVIELCVKQLDKSPKA